MVDFLFALPSSKKRQQLKQGMISKHNQIANWFQIEIKASFYLLGFSVSNTVSETWKCKLKIRRKNRLERTGRIIIFEINMKVNLCFHTQTQPRERDTVMRKTVEAISFSFSFFFFFFFFKVVKMWIDQADEEQHSTAAIFLWTKHKQVLNWFQHLDAK